MQWRMPFDCQVAERFAQLVVQRRQTGRPITTQDARIAAIALSNEMRLATPNTDDFAAIPGLTLIDPWQDG